jgi:hypothetical protein
MFDSNWGAGKVMCATGILAAIAGIVIYLVRAFRRRTEKPWPAFFVGIYSILLLLSYLFGVMTQVESEGFGFFPLLVLTTPWSWLVLWLLNSSGVLDAHFLDSSSYVVEMFLFAIGVYALPGAANSWILYLLLKRHQKKADEDAAWEQARRNR